MLESLLALEQQLTDSVVALVGSYGGLGILVGMFLESSIVPIPSEVILVTAGLLGFDPLTVAIYGTIGSTLGAIVGYFIGKLGGRPVIDKIGPYLFITQEKVLAAEQKFKEWGGWTVFVSRLIPFIPYKVFSITSGILKYDFKQFVFFTFIGSFPRCFLLAWIGVQIMQYREVALYVLGAVALLAIGYWLWTKRKR
ncbi:SNARE associated Golgi protein [Candidatus Norongarragalina meridionalis]|nr:SNARE associated Golgi protein [Candidatus Norongarragalina meridionalis]